MVMNNNNINKYAMASLVVQLFQSYNFITSIVYWPMTNVFWQQQQNKYCVILCTHWHVHLQ